jgi:REP element-mobilizing transposase RayT
MTSPRRLLIDPSAPGWYHCMSRCVRRAFLCGIDRTTGQSFEHRRHWIEDRLLELADCFAVGLYAYAVMGNHVHVVLRADPTTAHAWPADDVAERWVRLFPVRIQGQPDPDACLERARQLVAQPDRIAVIRERLASVSWFMRCLNEPIARRANREDDCTGRFWEGRFKCQALLDEAAVLACMAYVDLNPIRAGAATDLPGSVHTSARHRLRAIPAPPAGAGLAPVCGLADPGGLPCSLAAYLDMLDWTGRQLRPDKAGAISPEAPSVLAVLGCPADDWAGRVAGIERDHWRAIGAVDALLAKARAMGQRWLKGAGRGTRSVALRRESMKV